MTAREVGVVALDEALELTALMAQKGEWPRARRAAARWLERYLAERSPTIDGAVFVAGCLAALGGRDHGPALAALRELVHGEQTSGGATVGRGGQYLPGEGAP